MAMTPSAVFASLGVTVYTKATATRTLMPADPRIGGCIMIDETGVSKFYQKTVAQVATILVADGYSKEVIS